MASDSMPDSEKLMEPISDEPRLRYSQWVLVWLGLRDVEDYEPEWW